jgi:3-phenylpropionate/cinnamic acid dioxygenase small subunit
MTDIVQFIYEEGELLDIGDYDRWLDLFTEDARYWVPAYPRQTDPINEISLFYEDRILMHARIGRLRHPRALDAPVRTSHVIGNVRSMGRSERGDVIVKSRFQMIEFIADQQRLYGGAITHHLVEHDHGWKIRVKRIDLVNAGGVFDLLQGFF